VREDDQWRPHDVARRRGHDEGALLAGHAPRRHSAYYFTDHDADLLIDGHTYVSSVGYQQTAISADPALTVNNTEVTGYFDSVALTADDLRSGLFDFAEAQTVRRRLV
jgi:hypothetical protein